MSARLLRFDATRLEAMVFRTDSVRFEACTAFRAGADAALCDCGWLEHDHAGVEVAAVRARRFPRRRPARVAISQAS